MITIFDLLCSILLTFLLNSHPSLVPSHSIPAFAVSSSLASTVLCSPLRFSVLPVRMSSPTGRICHGPHIRTTVPSVLYGHHVRASSCSLLLLRSCFYHFNCTFHPSSASADSMILIELYKSSHYRETQLEQYPLLIACPDPKKSK